MTHTPVCRSHHLEWGTTHLQRRAATASVNRQTIRRLCEADLRTHCAGIRPGGGRLMQCARAHEAQLSADCRAALETLDAYRNARPN